MPGVRLGVEERETIGLGVARGEAFALIGRRMGRPTSTIAREIGRNGGVDSYRASLAQRATNGRASRPKVRTRWLMWCWRPGTVREPRSGPVRRIRSLCADRFRSRALRSDPGRSLPPRRPRVDTDLAQSPGWLWGGRPVGDLQRLRSGAGRRPAHEDPATGGSLHGGVLLPRVRSHA